MFSTSSLLLSPPSPLSSPHRSPPLLNTIIRPTTPYSLSPSHIYFSLPSPYYPSCSRLLSFAHSPPSIFPTSSFILFLRYFTSYCSPIIPPKSLLPLSSSFPLHPPFFLFITGLLPSSSLFCFSSGKGHPPPPLRSSSHPLYFSLLFPPFSHVFPPEC